jgi:NADPH:quinone reductase-like Zn-dependent oxidoreductase
VAYLELKRGGGYAELAAAKESAVALKSHALDFAEAASLPIAAVTALQGLRDVGELREGASVLINGAAGGVGHFGVQIARSLGAVTTATCGPSNVDFVRSLGADHVIDYSQQDFTQLTGRYDVIFDAAAKSRFGACRRLLKPGGTFVTTMPSPGLIFMYPLQWVIGLYENVKKGRFVIARPDGAELAFLGALAEKGRLRPTVSLKLPLADAGKAHDASEGGHTRGKIVLETYRGASLTVSADE